MPKNKKKQNAVYPSRSRGRQAHSCRGQVLQATSAQFTSDSAAHHGETGDDLTCGSRRRKRSNNDNIICCSEKGRFRIRPGFKLKSTSLLRIALRRAPCCKLMWASNLRAHAKAQACARKSLHTQTCDVRLAMEFAITVILSSCPRQSILFEHPQPWSIHRTSQCLSEPRRHDVLLSESIQLVLIFP